MKKPIEFYVSPQTRPTTIAKAILAAMDNKRNIEIIPASSEVMPRVNEGMTIAKCEGEFISEGENGRMCISFSI